MVQDLPVNLDEHVAERQEDLEVIELEGLNESQLCAKTREAGVLTMFGVMR